MTCAPHQGRIVSSLLKKVGHPGPPRRLTGGYDLAGVHMPSGKVHIAYTVNGTEVVDGEQLSQIKAIRGRLEGRGVLCAQEHGLVIAAARGVGKILVIEAADDRAVREVHAGFIFNSSCSCS